MSQKTGKRSRKTTDSPVVVIENKKETEDKAEIKTKNDLTKKDSNISTKTINNVEETKEIKDKPQKDNIQKPKEKESEKKDTSQTSETSINIIENESSTKSDEISKKSFEQESLDGEILEPLILEEANGVQILSQSEEIIQNGEGDEKKKDDQKKKEDTKEVNKEEKKINGEESHESLKNDDKIIETSAVDGKKSYNLEEIDLNNKNETTLETFNDLSTQAVVGSDVTRFTEDFEYSKFLSASKDHSLTESLRHLSARRSIRRSYYPGVVNFEQADASRKRKYFGGDSLEESKRAKKDSNSSGIMSYFAYPFAKKPEASSTPKLTGYKNNVFDNNDVNKIGNLNTSNEKTPSNKWCSVM
ncbi:myb-like protein X [Onthophagus taurus]|uniref:myb-like protein X n=1 Tax=Onthophagus taurus TaxID=166361 RepID=UPI000C1FDBF1|nr:titin homolog [Onthophagus taurus]